MLPLKNNFIFKFVDQVNSKGEFERPVTTGGIILQTSFDESAKSPRWVIVTHVGPECEFIAPGMKVLLPNLRWTINFKVDKQRYWKSDETQVAAYVDNDELIPTTAMVIFSPITIQEQQLNSGLILLNKAPTDTPSGNVIKIGTAVDNQLIGSVIYYNDVNFTDNFQSSIYPDKKLAFITQDSVIAFST